MIHYSHVRCEDCGERHTPGNPTECIEILKERVAELAADEKRLDSRRIVLGSCQFVDVDLRAAIDAMGAGEDGRA